MKARRQSEVLDVCNFDTSGLVLGDMLGMSFDESSEPLGGRWRTPSPAKVSV